MDLIRQLLRERNDDEQKATVIVTTKKLKLKPGLNFHVQTHT